MACNAAHFNSRGKSKRQWELTSLKTAKKQLGRGNQFLSRPLMCQ